ncbi:recombinase family protein [Mesorhizobium australicum]|uniref:recombinase family protein n=1 Tax=Mesorhizobium australicum TaxID=536018 RepID=UPI00333C66D9
MDEVRVCARLGRRPDLGDQLDRLKAAGCERIYHEKKSGKDAQHPRLKAMLRQIRPGDQVLAIATAV